MPSGVYRRSLQNKLNISKASMGRTPWNKGKIGIYSDETRYKMGASFRGKKQPKLAEFNRKKIFTEELRRKMSLRQKGEKGSNWRGGVGIVNVKIRNSIEGKLWREAVFARDGWICQKCLIKGGVLRAHHIYSFNKYNNMRFDIHNGVTLCNKCHKEFHSKYGVRDNNLGQCDKWLLR